MKKSMTKIIKATLGFTMAIGMGIGATISAEKAHPVFAESTTYSFSIGALDQLTSGSGYATYNGTHSIVATEVGGSSEFEVEFVSYQVMASGSNSQWQKSKGYIYNTTDLGTINSINITSSAGSFTKYYGTTEHPQSGTTVGNGFFTIAVGSATGTTSDITVNFTIASGGESKVSTTTSVSAQGNKTTLDVTASPADTVQLSASVTPDSGTITNPSFKWASASTSVATVDSNGLVTAIAKGTARITATYDGDSSFNGSTGFIDITVINPNEVIFESRINKGSSSGQNEDTITVDDITMSCTSMHDTDANGYRFYQNATLTFARSSGKIASIEFTGVSSYPISRLSVAPGSTGILTTSGNNGVWEGSANSVSFTATAQARATKIVVTYLTGADVVLDKASLTLLVGGSSSSVGVSEIDGVTNPDYSWDIFSGEDCVNLSDATTDTVTIQPKGSTFAQCQLSLTVNGDNLQEPIVRYVSVFVARNSSFSNPFNVAEAKNAIDLNDSTYIGEAYAAGIISEVGSFDSKYNSITYFISDDGTTGSQLQAYSGKNFGGANFAADTDVSLGAIVIIKGELKKHNTDYEFNYNNELVFYSSAVLHATENAGEIETVSITFNTKIAKDAWASFGTATEFGMMLFKSNKANPVTVEEKYNSDPNKDTAPTKVLVVNEDYGLTLDDETNNYSMTVDVLNIKSTEYARKFCVAPYLVAGGEHYFLCNMMWSVNSLANNGLIDSTLSETALNALKA